MVTVLIITNENKKDVNKIKDIIDELGKDYFIPVEVTVAAAQDDETLLPECDFIVSLVSRPGISNKKVIDGIPIITDRFGEKTEKDILNNLLRFKVRGHTRR